MGVARRENEMKAAAASPPLRPKFRGDLFKWLNSVWGGVESALPERE